MTIASDEVSVVVQGAFDTDFTPYMLAKLRDVLPEAEIILSTWAHPRLDLARFCDAVIVSDDPGGQPVMLQRRRDGARRLIWNNVDRQVVSTRADNVLTYDLQLPTWPFFAVSWAGDVSAVLLIAIRTYRLIFQPEKMARDHVIESVASSSH